MSPPSPPHRLELPPSPIKSKQNGIGHFHSISLRSPADQPVVLSFDGINGSGSVGVPTVGEGSEKSPVEGNSQNQLVRIIKLKWIYPKCSHPVKINDSPTAKFSRWRPLARSTGHLLASRRFLLALVALLTLLALLLVLSLVLVIISGGAQRQQPAEEDAAFLNKDSNWRDSCERNCSAKCTNFQANYSSELFRFDVPPLLLISMDGFRADYLIRKITPAVSRIMQVGKLAIKCKMPSSVEQVRSTCCPHTRPKHSPIIILLWLDFTQSRMAS